MSLNLSALRLRLTQSGPSGPVQRALAMLDSQKLKASGLNPVRNTARDVLSLWKTRKKTSAISSLVIPGVSDLIARVSQLPLGAPVEQYNFDSESSSGSIFMDPATGEFLGDTIVERHSKSRQMVELETQLFQSSRRSA
jgi:hypothetical protein